MAPPQFGTGSLRPVGAMSASPQTIATGRGFTSVEARIDAIAHGILERLPRHGLSGAAVEFLVFGLKQGWA